MKASKHVTISTEAGYLHDVVHTRKRTWSVIQRQLRRSGWIAKDDQLNRIARIDGGSAYNAPGVFNIGTISGAKFTVTISAHL